MVRRSVKLRRVAGGHAVSPVRLGGLRTARSIDIAEPNRFAPSGSRCGQRSTRPTPRKSASCEVLGRGPVCRGGHRPYLLLHNNLLQVIHTVT